DQDADLVDVANEILVDGADAGPTIGGDDDEAFAAQELQRFAHRVGGRAVALRELGGDKALVGLEAAADDLVADQLVDRRPLSGRPEMVDSGRRFGPEGAHLPHGALLVHSPAPSRIRALA